MELEEVRDLVRRQILTGGVWAHRNDPDFVEGLNYALRGSDRAVLVAACAELLTDADVAVRSGVVAVVFEFAADVGAEWLADTLEGHRELFVDIPAVGVMLTHSRLDRELLIAISTVVQVGQSRAIATLRKAAESFTFGMWVLPGLARVDGDWLCEHPELIPHKMISLLPILNSCQREKLVRRMVPWPDDVVEGISEDFWKKFSSKDAKMIQKWMRFGNEYSSPAPTHFLRFFLGMMFGLLSIGFLVFCIWGMNLTERVAGIRSLNKAGLYGSAWSESEDFKKVVNKYVIAAVLTFFIGWGNIFYGALKYYVRGNFGL